MLWCPSTRKDMGMLIVFILQTIFMCLEGREVKCPGDVVYCDSGYTCCLISRTEYGCCPLPSAVCCKDHIHCCPHGFGCDLATTSCFQHTEGGMKVVVDMVLKSLGKPIKDAVDVLDSPNRTGNVICPDKISLCPTGTTCCLMECGRYGCCQYDHGVCCEDHIHCCPHNYKCDIPYCTPLKHYFELPIKELAKNNDNGSYMAVVFHTCEGGTSRCGLGGKCCPVQRGYDCCVYPHGVCCSDGLHCCPRGFTCDITRKKCKKQLKQLPMAMKIKAKTINTLINLSKDLLMIPVNNVPNSISEKLCPDNQTKCKDNDTCCDDVGGGSFCCPFPEAVCCAKSKRCCPKGFVCEPGAGLCNKRTPPVRDRPLVVKCPDEVSTCPDNNTCCATKGGYGCCPLVNAVCCNDHKHCCPTGYKCSTDQGYCSRRGETILALKHTNALYPDVQDKFICPDKESTCFIGETCCLLQTHGYGCCPLPNAVCCEDKEHCCPHGYECWSGFCTRNLETPRYKKSRSLSGKVICPDGLSECNEGSSCCKISRGGYGCCPLPDAVCCGDYKHCCPKGFKCTKEGYCVSDFLKILAQVNSKALLDSKELAGKYPTFQIHHRLPEDRLPAHRKLKRQKTNVLSSRDRLLMSILRHEMQVCGNGVQRCKPNETCCPTPEGYSCCPFYDAVCCQHSCCPSGLKCTTDDCQSYLSSDEPIRFVP